MKKVIVYVHRGIVELVDAPNDVAVELHDHDIREIENDNPDRKYERDEIGDYEVVQLYTPPTGTPAESRYGRKLAELGAQYGREPKPLAQYLAEYVEQEDELYRDFRRRKLFEQALDAYQSTENVTIKIERVTE